MLFQGDVKCRHCKGAGTQQGLYTIPYPCEDCDGTGRLKTCEECGQAFGPDDYEDADDSVCGYCKATDGGE